jgi:hypothetical protein
VRHLLRAHGFEADDPQGPGGASHLFASVQTGNHQRQHDVLDRVVAWQQSIVLKDEADLTIAISRQFSVVQCVDIFVLHLHHAVVGVAESPDDP